MVDPRTKVHSVGDLRTHDAAGNLIEELKGLHVQVVSPSKLQTGEIVLFSTPSVVALSLEIAINAAREADHFRGHLTATQMTKTPFGNATSYGPDDVVYDCLQQSMIAVTFSYQALEVYCNDEIGFHAMQPVTITNRLKGGKPTITKAAGSFEAKESTETKLTEILPQLLGKPSPKHIHIWGQVKRLQRARNDVMHMKTAVSSPRAKALNHIPKATVLNEFLTTDAIWMPKAAIDMIKHVGVTEPWFAPILRSLSIELDAHQHKSIECG